MQSVVRPLVEVKTGFRNVTMPLFAALIKERKCTVARTEDAGTALVSLLPTRPSDVLGNAADETDVSSIPINSRRSSGYHRSYCNVPASAGSEPDCVI